MVQFLSIIFFFFGFLQFLLGFSNVTVFLCHTVLNSHVLLGLTFSFNSEKHSNSEDPGNTINKVRGLLSQFIPYETKIKLNYML